MGMLADEDKNDFWFFLFKDEPKFITLILAHLNILSAF